MVVYDFEYDHRFDPPSEETLRKLELSRREAATMIRRDINCPICGYRNFGAYMREGCIDFKCRRCKFNGPISLRYFRRQGGQPLYRW